MYCRHICVAERECFLERELDPRSSLQQLLYCDLNLYLHSKDTFLAVCHDYLSNQASNMSVCWLPCMICRAELLRLTLEARYNVGRE